MSVGSLGERQIVHTRAPPGEWQGKTVEPVRRSDHPVQIAGKDIPRAVI